MPLSLAYWFLLFLWILTSFWWGWQTPAPGRGPFAGWGLLLFLLFLFIGLKLFGAPIQ